MRIRILIFSAWPVISIAPHTITNIINSAVGVVMAIAIWS